MIYFMRPIGGGPIKIGYTEDVIRRKHQLEARYARPLELLATFPGGQETEAEIHEKFKHARLGATEQFRPTAELLGFLGYVSPEGENPDTVEAMEVSPNLAAYALTLRATGDWKGWLKRFADFCRRDMVGLVDEALVSHAEKKGFEEKPPKR